ncbi:MAG: arginine deiminase-related protein [Verrucomicrobiota bacterium]|nr:arginine deiminase-related protein [Verrucomicrobiota bacterium]
MIRPSRFFPNPETALDNAFQQEADESTADLVSTRAAVEFERAVEALRHAGVWVHVFDDTAEPPKPDAVFPNNWFSTHPDGRVALYPMYTPSRRTERRLDLINRLRESHRITGVIDYSDFEERDLFLEGTGSLVLDHVQRLAYVSLSRRADREPLEKFCADFDFEPVTFQSAGVDGQAIYHTNVMMCLGTEFVLIGLDSITNRQEREKVRTRLEGSGRTIVELSRHQIENFAGNALELRGAEEKLLVLSARAVTHLTAAQCATVERFARLLPLDLPTIELAGGSARCMLAEIHLPPR